MLMKFVKMLCLVALVAMSAAAAHAGSIGSDPRVTINCIKPCTSVARNFVPFSDPSFPPGGFTPNTALTIDFGVGNTLDYTYTGMTQTLEPNPHTGSCGSHGCLYVEILDIPVSSNATFSCGGNVFFPACFFVSAPHFNPGDTTYDEIFGFSMGQLVDGATYSVSEQPAVNFTPEPSTMLMFFSLVPALGFAKKRWNARQSA
jgi:hypothetical protein